jgi:hypothetical protein
MAAGRPQYRVTPNGGRYTRTTRRKVDAQRWLDADTAKIQTGNWADPKTARTTVGEWIDTWIAGYGTRRDSPVRQARVHLRIIREHFGEMRLGASASGTAAAVRRDHRAGLGAV